MKCCQNHVGFQAGNGRCAHSGKTYCINWLVNSLLGNLASLHYSQKNGKQPPTGDSVIDSIGTTDRLYRDSEYFWSLATLDLPGKIEHCLLAVPAVR